MVVGGLCLHRAVSVSSSTRSTTHPVQASNRTPLAVRCRLAATSVHEAAPTRSPRAGGRTTAGADPIELDGWVSRGQHGCPMCGVHCLQCERATSLAAPRAQSLVCKALCRTPPPRRLRANHRACVLCGYTANVRHCNR